MKVKIGSHFIGDNQECFVALEPSATYKNFEEAKKMIKASADAGAHAVKFQTFLPGDADRMMGKKEIKIEFRTMKGLKKESVYEVLKKRELTKEQWIELRNFAKEINLAFITSPYFAEVMYEPIKICEKSTSSDIFLILINYLLDFHRIFNSM